MPLPEPRLLLLCEAARRVADRCSVSIEEAKTALDRVFREHVLVLFDSRGDAIHDWEYATIDWEQSSITRRGPSVTYTMESVQVFRQHLDDWMAQAEPAPHRPSATTTLRAPAGRKTENPGKLVPLGIVHIDDHRNQLIQLIEARWQDGQLALWGRRKDTSHPIEKIKEYKGLELLWMAGPEREDYYCDVQAHPSVIGKRGYYRHRWEEIQIREEDLKQLCAEIAETAPGTETVSQSDSIPHDGGPFPHWDNTAWDRPVRLLDAIKLWSPQFGRRLDELAGPVYWKWRSADDIGQAAQQRQRARMMYDHPTSAAMFERKGGADIAAEVMPDTDAAADAEIPGSLRNDLVRLLHEWARWDDKDRVVHATELAGRLVIEKTRQGQPYSLKYAPPASPGDLSADYLPVGEARHDALGPYDLDLRASTIRNRGGNWLPVRVVSGIEAEAEYLRLARVAREAHDAAAAAWAAESHKPEGKRQYFGFDEIAKALARRPRRLEVDSAEHHRILHDLVDWVRRGKFGESDVVILSGDPPDFVPRSPLLPSEILATRDTLIRRPGECTPGPLAIVDLATPSETLFLRCRAARQYIENSALEGALRVLKEWFPETVATGKKSSTAHEDKPGGSLHADINTDEEASRTGQRRAAYRGALDSWMAQQQLPVLQKMGATAIAREFKSHCEQRLPGVVPLLPKRLRSMENVIERIIKRRVEALRTQNRSRKSASNGQ